MNERIETAIRAVGLLLVPSVLVIILSAGGVSASDGSLELSDFNREGLEVEVAALFEAGGAGSEPALYSASGSRWTESGSLVDGEVLLGEGSSIVRVMLPESDGSLLRLNHDGPLVLRDYFGSSGDGADLTVWIQTAQGAVSFAASDVRTVGSSYVNFNVPQAARSALSGIASGDRFILALTRPAPAPEPTPEPTETPTPEPTVAPGKITGLTLTSSRPGHLWISWDEPVPAPTEYRLNWAPVDDPFPAWNSNQGGNLWLSPRTAQDFSNLVEAGVTYKLRMRAIYKDDPEGNWAGDWSDVMTKRVRNHPPAAPTNLSAGSVTYDGLTLKWNAPDHNGLTGYRILRGTSADALETLVADTGNLGQSYTDTPEGYDKTYHYAVIALSLDGNSSQSATVSATTLARPQTPATPVIEGAPAAPSGLTASLDGAGGVSLSWTDPNDDGITGYRVLRGDDAQSMRIISENTGSASVAYLDASSRVNRTHVYAVQARNATGLSQLSNTVSVTPLGAPTNLLVANSPNSEVSLNWTAPSTTGVTGYHIRRGPSADALSTLVADTGATATTYTDTTTKADTTYHYTVGAIGPHGEGPSTVTVSVTVPAAPQLVVPRDPVVIVDDELPVSLPQEEDPCAPEIESVGGSASNGSVRWVWKSVAPPAPAAGVDGCKSRSVDFRLSYSDDYGATFTGVEVVRHYIHNTDTETITIGGKELNRNEEYHSASTPELSIVSKLRVEVGCDAAGANCAHSRDSAPGSFKPYYRSRSTGRYDGANTKALLVPANYCTDCQGNARVIGWLDIGEDPHTYRIHMTAGRTYVFDETYRKWAMTSGEWRGGPHFYLPDEFRLSLFTKNSAGELVPVSGFQNQPKYGWQVIYEDDPDKVTSVFQRFGVNYVVSKIGEYFNIIEQLIIVFDNAHLFPPGHQHRNACTVDGSNVCGLGLDIERDEGRQLQNASYVPTRSGIYYLQVTRVRDDQPVWRGSSPGWSILIDNVSSVIQYQPVYASSANKSSGVRNAMPYYEISVEVHGPTLSSVKIDDHPYDADGYWTHSTFQDRNFGFYPGRFDYRVGLFLGMSAITITATAAHTDATVTISPPDADTSTDGHQVNATPNGVKVVTITVTRGSDTEVYTINFSQP